jgi:hypothetical protein
MPGSRQTAEKVIYQVYSVPDVPNAEPRSKVTEWLDSIYGPPSKRSKDSRQGPSMLDATRTQGYSYDSTRSRYDLQSDTRSNHGRSTLYTPSTGQIRQEKPRMSTIQFERATDIHIKTGDPDQVVQCLSGSHYTIHAWSLALHQTFLPERTTASRDWALYHIHFKPNKSRLTGYETLFHSTGPLDNSGIPDVRKLLESYGPGQEPGYDSVNALVTEIQATRMPLWRAISFEEKTNCLAGFQSAAERTIERLGLSKDGIQIESFVSVCPENELLKEVFVKGVFVKRVEMNPTYNVWLTVKT